MAMVNTLAHQYTVVSVFLQNFLGKQWLLGKQSSTPPVSTKDPSVDTTPVEPIRKEETAKQPEEPASVVSGPPPSSIPPIPPLPSEFVVGRPVS